jgi:hypothetical protein
MQPNESQEAAIAKIEAFGGQVSLANSEARKLLEAQGGERADITRVIIPHNWSGGTDGLRHLQSIDGLEELWLSGVGMDELHLVKLPDLKRVVFTQSYFDKDLDAQVFAPKLSIKSVRLQELPRLEQLDLTATTAEHLTLDGVPNLRSVNLSGTAAANDETLVALKTELNLESLNVGSLPYTAYLPQETPITDTGLEALAGLTRLKTVDFSGARITDRGLRIIAKMEGLESLNLGGTSVTNEGLQHLVGLAKLTTLDLRGTKVTDAGLQKLAALPNLASLSIGETGITAAGVAGLKEFPALTNLNLDSRQASRDALSELSKLRVLWLVGRSPETATLAELPGLMVLGLEGTQQLEIEPGRNTMSNVRTVVLSGVSKQVTDAVLTWLDGIETMRGVSFRRGWQSDGTIDATARVHLTPNQLERLKAKFPGANIDADLEENAPYE